METIKENNYLHKSSSMSSISTSTRSSLSDISNSTKKCDTCIYQSSSCITCSYCSKTYVNKNESEERTLPNRFIENKYIEILKAYDLLVSFILPSYKYCNIVHEEKMKEIKEKISEYLKNIDNYIYFPGNNYENPGDSIIFFGNLDIFIKNTSEFFEKLNKKEK
jgi:hypothetical protein